MLNNSSETSYLDITPLADILNSIKEAIERIDVPAQPDSVEINNLDEIKLYLRQELGRVLKPVINITARQAKFPSDIKVNNLSELVPVIESLKEAIAKLDKPQAVQFPPAAPVVNIDIDRIVKHLEPLKFISDRANKPVAVRMSDGQKFIKALQKVEQVTKELTKSNDQLGVVYAGSSGMNSDDFKSAIRDVDDVLGQYRIVDIDDDASPNFYGFVDRRGHWYIMRETLSDSSDAYRYAAGGNDYTTNWTGRTGLTYDYFDAVF